MKRAYLESQNLVMEGEREDKEKEERKYAVFAAEVDNTDIELKF